MKLEPTNKEVFLTKLIFYFFGKAIYKEYADRLPISGYESVLDFGSGMGTVAYYMSKRLSYGNLVCLDVSSKWMSACKKLFSECQNISFMHGDINTLPLKNESFDLIYCHFVLHDIADSDLKKIINAMVRLLKPKGILAFREPLDYAEKLNLIQNLIENNGFLKKDSRITDAPFMNTTLENIYIKS